jgi:predicted Zn-dependent peptidase
MRRASLFTFSFGWLAVFLIGAGLSWAADASLNLPVQKKILKNGLTVLVLEKPGVPVVSFSYMVPVGAQDAPKGKTGLSHMLEHMMFKGTETLGTTSYAKEKPILEAQDKVALAINAENDKLIPSQEKLKNLDEKMKKLQDEQRSVAVVNELWNLYAKNGGLSLNAYTSQDVTNYHITLPANKVLLYATIEEGRLKHPVFREFYSERDVVAQERRWNETMPDRVMWEALCGAAFTASPYKEPVLGWMTDIKKLIRTDAENFYRQAYRPDRAVLAVVGGVKASEVFSIFEKTIGTVPNPPVAPLKPDWSKEPPQTGEKTVKVRFDADPMVMMAWHKPAFPDKDAVTMEILSDILTGGNTSRLNKRLVFDKKMATSVSCMSDFPGDRIPNLFILQFNPSPKMDPAQVMEVINQEIENIRKNGVTNEELDRARRGIKSSTLWQTTSTMGMAEDLAWYQAVYGDWSYFTRYLDMASSVTSKDIQDAVGKYLVPDNRTIATLERTASK